MICIILSCQARIVCHSVGQVPSGVNTATKGGVKPKKITVSGTMSLSEYLNGF